MWTVVTFTVAVAAESDPQLAIPAPGPPPRAAVNRPPQMSDVYQRDMARAMRAYRSRYLSLRQVSELSVGTSWGYGWYGSYSTGHMGWGVMASPQPWVAQRNGLAVYEGPRQLDMPAAYRALGDPDGAQRLERKIKSNKRAAGFLYTVGVAGMAASIGGLIASENAETWEEAQEWTTVSWMGVGATAVGFIGASLPSSRARRLKAEPEAAFDDLDALQSRIDARNEQIAAELGLPPELAVTLEPAR